MKSIHEILTTEGQAVIDEATAWLRPRQDGPAANAMADMAIAHSRATGKGFDHAHATLVGLGLGRALVAHQLLPEIDEMLNALTAGDYGTVRGTLEMIQHELS